MQGLGDLNAFGGSQGALDTLFCGHASQNALDCDGLQPTAFMQHTHSTPAGTHDFLHTGFLQAAPPFGEPRSRRGSSGAPSTHDSCSQRPPTPLPLPTASHPRPGDQLALPPMPLPSNPATHPNNSVHSRGASDGAVDARCKATACSVEGVTRGEAQPAQNRVRKQRTFRVSPFGFVRDVKAIKQLQDVNVYLADPQACTWST
jgi:hypothetical protein